MSKIEFVWFDFGGVLSPPIPEIFKIYQTKTSIPVSTLIKAMEDVAREMCLPMLAPIESAILTEYEWGSRLRSKLLENEPSLDLSKAHLENFGQQWFDGISSNEIMVKAFRKIKCKGLNVGILTNNVIEWEPHWKKMLQLEETVDLIIDSSIERCRKPEKEFFDLACKKSIVKPENTLLIDDTFENITAAVNCGWQAIHFTENNDTLEKLQKILGIDLTPIKEYVAC